jgi:8-oxo-dGTP diphosphatase
MKPRIIIVNENDEVIGHKERGTTIPEKDIYRTTGLWITNPRGDVLLAKRHHNKRFDPDRWGPAVAGTVDEGETYDQNIIKEAEEELGLKEVRLKKGPKIRHSGKTQYFGQWYLLTINRKIEEFRIQEDEVEEIKWFPAKELKEMVLSQPDMFVDGMAGWVKQLIK